MTVASTSPRVNFTGSGTAGPFAFTYRVFAAADLEVTKRDAFGNETELVYPSQFTLSAGAVGNRNGGSVTLAAALASGEHLTIRRAPAITQPSDFRNLGSFLPETHENSADRQVMISQYLQDEIDRSLRLPVTVDPGTVSTELPVPSANAVLVWDAVAGALTNRILDASINVALPGNGRTVSTLTAYLANNAVFNVKDYGAVGNGSTDDTAAFQLAASKVNVAGGWLRIPQTANNYLVTDTISITNHGVRVVGDSWRSSGILFNPATSKVCFDFICSNAAQTLTNCGIAHLFGLSSNAVQKTFIRATDFSGFEMDHVRTSYTFTTSATPGTATVSPANPSIGLETRGREILRANSIEFFTDKPVLISPNPRHATIDCDFFQFNDTYLSVTFLLPVAGSGTVSAAGGAATFSTSQAGLIAVGGSITVAGVLYQINTFNGTTGATISDTVGLPTFGASAFTRTAPSDQYCVTIGTPTTGEIRGLFNLHFGGENIWTGSKGGINWTSLAASADAVGIKVENGRLEQSQNSKGHYINIDRNAYAVYGVQVVNVQPSIAQTGIRLRNCTHTSIDTLEWSDVVGINKVIDIDATVTKTRWRNLWTQVGGQASLVGQTLTFAITRANGVDLSLPTDAYYDVSTFGGAVFGSNISLLSGAKRYLKFTSGTIDTYLNDGVTLVHREYFTGRQVHIAGITIGTEAAATILSQITVYAPNITPASVAAQSTVEQTFSVPGLAAADKVIVNRPAVTNNIGITGARVSAVDTLALSFTNPTAGALTPTAGVYPVIAIRS